MSNPSPLRESIEREGEILVDRAPADPAIQAIYEPLVAEADREIAASTLTLRWDEAHVALLKRAAAAVGVPLSSYAKLVLWRQAIADLELARDA